MSIASFEEESKLVQETAVSPQNLLQGMSGWLVKKGLASDQASANLTLVVVVVLIVLGSGFLLYKSSPSSKFITIPKGVDPAVYEATGKAPIQTNYASPQF